MTEPLGDLTPEWLVELELRHRSTGPAAALEDIDMQMDVVFAELVKLQKMIGLVRKQVIAQSMTGERKNVDQE